MRKAVALEWDAIFNGRIEDKRRPDVRANPIDSILNRNDAR